MAQVTVQHSLSMTSPDNPAYENKPSNWNQAHLVTLSLSSNDILALSAGASSQSTGVVQFSNANGVTWGLNAGTLTASVAGAAQSSLSFANSNGVTFGVAGSTLTATVATNYQSQGAYLTTAALSQDSSKYAQTGFTSTTTAGTALVGTLSTNGLSLGVPAWLTTTPSAISNINLSAGTTSQNLSAFVLSNSNNVSFGLSGSTVTATATIATAGFAGTGFTSTTTAGAVPVATLSTNGLSMGVPAWLTTADLSANSSNYARNWKLTGNTAGTTSSAVGTDLWLGGGNGVTVSGSSNTISFSVATNYQSQGAYLTTAALSGDTSKYVQNWKLSGNTAGTTSSAQGTDLWLAGGNGVTVSGSSNTISFSVATNYQSQGAYLTTADLSQNSSKYVQNWKLTGNTAGTTSSAQGTDLWISGGANVTVSGSSNTIVISAPSPGAGGGVVLFDGANSITSGTARFTNANGVSFTFNGQTISGSVNTSYRASNDAIGLNTAQTNVTWTVNSSGLSLNAAGYAGTGTSTGTVAGTAVQMTLNTNGLSFLNPEPVLSSFEPFPLFASNGITAASNASLAGAFVLPQAGSFSFIRMAISHNNIQGSLASNTTTLNASAQAGTTWNAVVYSMATGANSKTLTSVASGSGAMSALSSLSCNSNGSQYTHTQQMQWLVEGGTSSLSAGVTTSSSNINFLTTVFSDLSAIRFLDIPFATSLSPGPYWLIVGLSTSSATNSTFLSAQTSNGIRYTQNILASLFNANLGVMGNANRSTGGLLGGGSFSTAAGGTTAALPISALSTIANQCRLHFQLLQSA